MFILGRSADRGKGVNPEFYESYSNSDFETDLDYIVNQHQTPPVDGEMSWFNIKCDALLKLLPYEGFYPIARTTQIASLFSASVDTSSSVNGANVELLHYNSIKDCWEEVIRYGPNLVGAVGTKELSYNYDPRLSGVRTQGITTPLFGPGILYNSIKSGIAVGWTIVTSSVLSDVYKSFDVSTPQINDDGEETWSTASVLQHNFLNTCLYQNPDIATKIPFEAMWDLSLYPKSDGQPSNQSLRGAYHINYPEALQGLSTTAGSGNFAVSDNFMVRMKDIPTTPVYEMAMNNFLSEAVRFFLRDRTSVQPNAGAPGELTTFKSQTPDEIVSRLGNKPKTGATYYMDIILEAPKSFTMCKSYWNRDNLYYNQMVAEMPGGVGLYAEHDMNWSPDDALDFSPGDQVVNFSCSFNGRYFGPATQKWYNYWNYKNPVSGAHYNVCDPAQAPYTPPYFYGPSRVTFEYTVGDEWIDLNKNVWQAIFSKMTASFSNPQLEAKIDEGYINKFSGVPQFNTQSFAYVQAQSVRDSLIIDGTTNEGPLQETVSPFDPTAPVQTYSNNYNSDSTRWVVTPKWECPVLDFSTQPNSSIAIAGGLHPTCSFSSSAGFLNNTPIGLGTGMWSGYGINDPVNGVRITFVDTPGKVDSQAKLRLAPDTVEIYDNSLLRLAGFAQGSGGPDGLKKYIGKLAPERTISEAVVAIPYVQRVNNANSKYAPTTTESSPYFEGYNDRFFFTIREEIIFQRGTRTLKQTTGHPEVDDMIDRMQKYILPPQLDFIKNNRLSPIVMYILPFSTTLDQRDLQDIWQGVLPDIGMGANLPAKNTTTTSEITHQLGSNRPFYQGKPMPPDIRWMVFKIKQRGHGDYADVTTTMTDTTARNISQRGQIDTNPFTYNWPYDFCSLIELAKIETNFGITPRPAGSAPSTTVATGKRAPITKGVATTPEAPLTPGVIPKDK